jgi:hypothetical protein
MQANKWLGLNALPWKWTITNFISNKFPSLFLFTFTGLIFTLLCSGIKKPCFGAIKSAQ